MVPLPSTENSLNSHLEKGDMRAPHYVQKCNHLRVSGDGGTKKRGSFPRLGLSAGGGDSPGEFLLIREKGKVNARADDYSEERT